MAQAPPEQWMIEVEDLFLDQRNPRVVMGDRPSQLDLAKYLYEREALDELVTSLIENGYFVEEPLVAIIEDDQYVVVEGNRRLAALKMLLDPKLRLEVGAIDWPDLTRAQRNRLSPVPVVVYADRSSVMAFLGYRHITGAKKWAPYQKSRFVAQLVEMGHDLSHIEDLIGDSTQSVKKLYQQHVVFRQATEELGVEPERLRSRFSLLEVALGQRTIKAFLGMPRSLPSGPTTAVVPDSRHDELEEVVEWIFGSDRASPVIGDSRDINRKLAKVLGSPEATLRLRETADLDLAYEMTDGEQQSLLKRLTRAERAIRDSAELLPLYSTDEDVIAAVGRVVTLAQGLGNQIR
jgi:hypothetical protein